MDVAAIKDWIDALSKLATPFVLAWIGLLIVRRVEARKAGVARSSDFKKRWADNFYDTSQEFMRSTERYMSILNQLQGMADPNGVHGTNLQEELNTLNVRLGELHLAIGRLSYFAPKKGPCAIQTSTAVQDYLGEVVRSMKGSLFSIASLARLLGMNPIFWIFMAYITAFIIPTIAMSSFVKEANELEANKS